MLGQSSGMRTPQLMRGPLAASIIATGSLCVGMLGTTRGRLRQADGAVLGAFPMRRM